MDDKEPTLGVPPDPRLVVWEYKDEQGRLHKMFEGDLALATLLMKEIVFINSTKEGEFVVYLNCNDLFAWGTSDCERLKYSDLEDVYNYYLKDPNFGTDIWCVIKRNQMPQAPCAKAINESGLWNLDELQKQHKLRPNWYDNMSIILNKIRYNYMANNNLVMPCSLVEAPPCKEWYNDWVEFAKNNPKWYLDEEMLETEKFYINEFAKKHGYDLKDDDDE